MKILITGGTGFLGCRLARFLGLSHEVVALGSRQLDITDREEVLHCFMEQSPRVVIHLAAIADTQYCEQNPDDSLLINVQGTKHVAEAAAAVGAKLIFASSEQVYNGQEDGMPNVEQQYLQPRSVYARHKLEAERIVAEVLPTSVSLRLTWMYDLPSSPLPQRSGLLINLIAAAREGRVLKASTRERRGITHVWDVVRRIEAAFALPGGAYNFGSTTEVSTFDTYLAAARTLKEAGLLDVEAEQLVEADESWTRNLAIDLGRLQQFGISFPSTLTGLQQAVFHHRKS
ncbi:MAG: sugar nucleotide-binding protein [Bacteroidales bacterium]|nr:sugar nucleotide-binding protein [Bacteroidales bacterium]